MADWFPIESGGKARANEAENLRISDARGHRIM